MVDAQGQAVVVGGTVTLTGTVTAVKDESVTLTVPQPVVEEYPKMISPGVIATSKAHEAELLKAPAPAKAADDEDDAAKAEKAEHAKPGKKGHK